MKRQYLRGLKAVCVAALSGCASLSEDGGLNQVSALTRERIAQPVALQRGAAQAETAQARISELLKTPLNVDAAVEVALLSNRELQAQLANLGIAEADLVRAGRLRNPGFSFGRLNGNGVVEYDRAVMFDLLGLLTMPMRRQIEQRRFERAQIQAAQDAVTLAANTRRAYFNAVGAQEQFRYLQQVRETADIANELAKRMAQAGNFNRLTQMREQAFYADTTAQVARVQQQALADRERLTRLLGLTGEQAKFQLPDRLPELPKQPMEVRGAEQTAMEKRLDIQIAKRQAEALARALGLTQSTRVVNVLELGYQNKSETGVQRSNGYEISLELPIFDFGTVRVARAEATYLQAMNRVAALGVQAQSEVRESHAAYRMAYELARHYRDEVVPLRKRISEENLLRYNGMLISVFELLADAREQVASVSNALAALRDFWIAQANLDNALTAGSPVAAIVLPMSSPAAAPTLGH